MPSPRCHQFLITGVSGLKLDSAEEIGLEVNPVGNISNIQEQNSLLQDHDTNDKSESYRAVGKYTQSVIDKIKNFGKKSADEINGKLCVDYIIKYENLRDQDLDLSLRPNFWGGYTFTPYYFEFWKGHKNRLNKREVFTFTNNIWESSFLQP